MSARLQQEAAARYPVKTAEGIDTKAWAKRFIYRAEKGDRDLLPVQVAMAYAALGQAPPGRTA